MSWQMPHWFLVPLTGKRDKGDHGDATINNARIITDYLDTQGHIICMKQHKAMTRNWCHLNQSPTLKLRVENKQYDN